jgi:hypothetical protein
MNALIRKNAPATTPGTKTHHGLIQPNHKESMSSLHNPAWWTYVKLTSAYHVEDQFLVRLLKTGGDFAFDNKSCIWTQNSGKIHHLPWAIPAKLADAMGLYLEITCLETDLPTFVSRVIGFHEMPHMSPYDRYLFVDGSGHIKMAWAGQFRVWPEPAWGESHRIVTPLAYGDPTSSHYYPTGWLERIDL